MPRPLRPDGRLQVRLFVTGKYRYAATQVTTRDPETGRYVPRKTIYGTVSYDLAFTPNARYLSLSAAQKDGLAFPPEWKMPAAAEPARRGRPSYTGECRSLLYGNTLFLEGVARSVGLTSDLAKALGDKQFADEVLTLALFSIISLECYNHLASYQAFQKFPCDRRLDSWDVTRITKAITEQHRQDFFALRCSRACESQWIGIDSTSYSSYGRHTADLRRGRNKEGDDLKQINELVVYGLESRLPVYYRKLPGNMVDSVTLKLTLKQLRIIGFERLSLMMDRGYLTLDALELLVKGRHPFILAAKTNLGCVDDAIAGLDMGSFVAPANWIDAHAVYGTVCDVPFQVTVKGLRRDAKPLRLYLFFNNEANGRDKDRVAHELYEEGLTLANLQREGAVLDATDKKQLSRYHDLQLDAGDRLTGFSQAPGRAERATRHSGFFAFLCNLVDKTPAELLDLYGMRDVQEKSFDTIKTGQNGRRLRTSTELSNDGRLFIQFLALILNSRIEHVMIDKGLYETYPTRKLLIESLTPIRSIEHPNRERLISEMLKPQREVFEAFGIEIPLQCRPKKRKATRPVKKAKKISLS